MKHHLDFEKPIVELQAKLDAVANIESRLNERKSNIEGRNK